MRFNYQFRDINHAIPMLFSDLLEMGQEVGSRNGRTKELPFTGITLMKPQQREILIPGRKHILAAQIAETMWVLAGRNDIEWLSLYLPRASDYSDNGATWRSGYGPRLRAWRVTGADYDHIDQLGRVVELLRETPSTRQAVINIWNPEVDSTAGKDIACNNWLHFLSREGYLDLHVAVRSNDAMWGWSGINAFEWSTLLEMVAGMVGLNIGQLHFSVSSFHLYEQHWEKAERLSREVVDVSPVPSPRFDATGLDDMESFDYMTSAWFMIEAEIRRQAEDGVTDLKDIIDGYPEPMLRSWLRVLAWWWTGDTSWFESLVGTDLHHSARLSVQPAKTHKVNSEVGNDPQFIDRVVDLHNQKNTAYGDSWCKRGEMLGIMANIARKVDRIESGKDTDDETQLDTAIDLFVYLAKYQAWLGNNGHPDLHVSNSIMRAVAKRGIMGTGKPREEVAKYLVLLFCRLEDAVMQGKGNKNLLIDEFLEVAWGNVMDHAK